MPDAVLFAMSYLGVLLVFGAIALLRAPSDHVSAVLRSLLRALHLR